MTEETPPQSVETFGRLMDPIDVLSMDVVGHERAGPEHDLTTTEVDGERRDVPACGTSTQPTLSGSSTETLPADRLDGDVAEHPDAGMKERSSNDYTSEEYEFGADQEDQGKPDHSQFHDALPSPSTDVKFNHLSWTGEQSELPSKEQSQLVFVDEGEARHYYTSDEKTINPSFGVFNLSAAPDSTRTSTSDTSDQIPVQSSSRNDLDGRSTSDTPPITRHPKRKSSSAHALDSADGASSGGNVFKRVAHNMVEKRYRVNLNDKITALRNSVPSLRARNPQPRNSTISNDPSSTTTSLKKAQILTKAIEYISQLESHVRTLTNENTSLKARLSGTKKVSTLSEQSVNISSEASASIGLVGGSVSTSTTPGTTPSIDPQGMIQVPEAMKKLRMNQSQPHYEVHWGLSGADLLSQEMEKSGGTKGKADGGLMQKSMVGSLAGLL